MVKHAYIHIPFCKKKCHYCSFVSGVDLSYKDYYIKALLEEITKKYKNEKLSTLYFGGGTPSLLGENDFEKIISCFNLNLNCEVTIEANPETVSFLKFKNLRSLGINRVSLGVQTFDSKILKIIGRCHKEKEILKSVEIIKNSDFNNISIDLIYGLPMQTMDMLRSDLLKSISLNIDHISTYGLKIEENSFFYNYFPSNVPDNDMQADMYLFLCDFLKQNNFTHYEISNFAKKGKESKHNLVYWTNKNYYGFGLNASGYEKNIRYKNTSDFSKYIENPHITEERYELSEKETLEYEIILALRLKKGINICNLNHKYKIDFIKKYEKTVQKYQKLKLIKITQNHLGLTEQGMLLSNEIMEEFID